MFADRIEGKWIDAFAEVFERCAVKAGDTAAILSETQSRPVNVHVAELALLRLGAKPALGGLRAIVEAIGQAGFVVECTVEGLMHAAETPATLKDGARILAISNEHPETLERLRPDLALEGEVRAGARMLRAAKRMRVSSAAGTDLTIAMEGAATVGVWGWTDRPGTLAHWPGGLVVSFPKAGAVNGTLVLAEGDINLTFKRYLATPVRLAIANDYVT